ncbi:hypothetical protein Halru_0086 [Halovivax ruber XH-70]|uniref:Uncharacterized protein n=1 Tax=Halovivax ruber (strain DSM 18193 / JCM 13892 / XH-70) TaxID=797302 RepID=L0I7H6_HALRX|nr:hypothetical protein [Halovivax ruber]AGB14738.1 hypothetical protein Halru_0086 [Halovivax ruber XH-70]
MREVLAGFDSRRGLVGFVVVVSLVAGFMVVSNEVQAGDREALLYFLLFVIVLVAVVLGGAYAWRFIEE